MGLDSVDIIRKIEHALHINIPNKEAATIVTIANLYDVVWKNISNNNETNRKTVEAIINQIVANVAGVELHEIQPYKKLTDDLGID